MMTKITWGKQKETFVLQLLLIRSAMNTDHKFIMTCGLEHPFLPLPSPHLPSEIG